MVQLSSSHNSQLHSPCFLSVRCRDFQPPTFWWTVPRLRLGDARICPVNRLISRETQVFPQGFLHFNHPRTKKNVTRPQARTKDDQHDANVKKNKHPGRLTAGTYKSPIWKGKWSEPNLHHYGPCLSSRVKLRMYPRRKGHRQSRLSFKSGTSGADEVKSLHSGQKATVQDMEVPRFALKKTGHPVGLTQNRPRRKEYQLMMHFYFWI